MIDSFLSVSGYYQEFPGEIFVALSGWYDGICGSAMPILTFL